jgi:hypothetical protein
MTRRPGRLETNAVGQLPHARSRPSANSQRAMAICVNLATNSSLAAYTGMPIAQDGCYLAKLRRGHFFLVAAAVVLLALFRPSYFGSLAGTDRFLLFRLLMS